MVTTTLSPSLTTFCRENKTWWDTNYIHAGWIRRNWFTRNSPEAFWKNKEFWTRNEIWLRNVSKEEANKPLTVPKHSVERIHSVGAPREINIVIEATSPKGRFSGHFANFSKSSGLVLQLFSVHICINQTLKPHCSVFYYCVLSFHTLSGRDWFLPSILRTGLRKVRDVCGDFA